VVLVQQPERHQHEPGARIQVFTVAALDVGLFHFDFAGIRGGADGVFDLELAHQPRALVEAHAGAQHEAREVGGGDAIARLGVVELAVAEPIGTGCNRLRGGGRRADCRAGGGRGRLRHRLRAAQRGELRAQLGHLGGQLLHPCGQLPWVGRCRVGRCREPQGRAQRQRAGQGARHVAGQGAFVFRSLHVVCASGVRACSHR
jgi:hypothetical protein